MNADAMIEVGRRIGRRIVERALWEGDVCTWEVEAFDARIGRSRTTVALGGLYQGTAGIALFLGELARVTGDAGAARAAVGALRHSLAWAAGLPPASFAFHGGRVGAAWVAARLAAALGRPELRREVPGLIAPLAGREERDSIFDVISGAGGAIPALLALAGEADGGAALAIACRLGDRLIAAARREPGGWSWATMSPGVARNLTGLAHGVSGIAVALLELARATGSGRYRFAAEMGFLYERRLFDPERSNWPDLRHPVLNELLYSGDPDAARAAAVAGTVPPYRPVYMTAWCHGAAGIGLARLRALALTGAEIYRREAEAALATTLPGLRPPVRNNYSFCHGAAGNCELPLVASELFADPSLRAVCEACAEYGWETYERVGVPWPCGTFEQRSDPSLMVGEAGIGHFYLRLADPETPSVLLPEPAIAAGASDDDGGFGELAASWVEETFGTARRAFAALGAPSRVRPPATATPLETSPVETAYRELRDAVEGARGRRRELLVDAFALERERYELNAVPNDLAAAYVRRLRTPAPDAVEWTTATFARAEDLRRVSTRWDWIGWPREEEVTAAAAAPPEDDQEWVVQRRDDRFLTRRVGPLTALVLDALEPPARLEELVERAAAALDGAVGGGALAGRILSQLRELVTAGLVEIATPLAVAGEGSARPALAAVSDEPTEAG
jgi:class II lanthipeptide synthase